MEAEALYDMLERDVIPTFYDRARDRTPRAWIELMKSSIMHLCPFVNTHRMVGDYLCSHYFKAHDHFHALDAEGAARARALAAWMNRVRNEWPRVRIEEVLKDAGATLPVGTNMRVRARVHLAGLSPDDVVVELYMGLLDASGEIVQPSIEPMKSTAAAGPGAFLFETVASSTRSGQHGYTVRVRPSHPDLLMTFVPGLLCWADGVSGPAPGTAR